MLRLLTICVACFSFVGSAAAEKTIALTFDDAPLGRGPVFTGEERTQALIAALEEAAAVPSAIFVTTDGLEDEPSGRQRIEAYADAGHLIANHSHSHPWLHQTPLADYIADVEKAEDLLNGIDNRRPWFRFPFLDEGRRDLEKRDGMRAALDERGLQSGYVTVDTYDWHIDRRWKEAVKAGKLVDRDALRDVYVAMVVEAAEHYAGMSEEWLGRQPAHVLLLHENDAAALFVTDAVSALREAGWTIVSPDVAFADPIAEELPETTFSGMGRVAALAYDKGGRGAEAFDHWSADEAGIDAWLMESGAIAP